MFFLIARQGQLHADTGCSLVLPGGSRVLAPCVSWPTRVSLVVAEFKNAWRKSTRSTVTGNRAGRARPALVLQTPASLKGVSHSSTYCGGKGKGKGGAPLLFFNHQPVLPCRLKGSLCSPHSQDLLACYSVFLTQAVS